MLTKRRQDSLPLRTRILVERGAGTVWGLDAKETHEFRADEAWSDDRRRRTARTGSIEANAGVSRASPSCIVLSTRRDRAFLRAPVVVVLEVGLGFEEVGLAPVLDFDGIRHAVSADTSSADLS